MNKTKKWQNLFYSKCPNCNTKMEKNNGHLICPNPHPVEKSKNCFFIKITSAIQFLLDEKHAANYCLTLDERARLNDAIQSISEVEVNKQHG